jgi:hypothetical protein
MLYQALTKVGSLPGKEKGRVWKWCFSRPFRDPQKSYKPIRIPCGMGYKSNFGIRVKTAAIRQVPIKPVFCKAMVFKKNYLFAPA